MSHPQVPLQRTTHRVVSLAGELDLATVGELAAAINFPSECLVLDLSAVTFLDASGLGVIAGAAERARHTGGTLTITGAAPNVEMVLRVTRFHQLLAEPVGS